jgi:hypothetical protein
VQTCRKDQLVRITVKIILMRVHLFKCILILTVCCTYCFPVLGQVNILSLNSENRSISWKVRAEADVKEGVEQICRADYNPADWVNAIVPGTVFSSYVADSLEKDPNFGDNIYRVDKSRYDRNFWYRTTFETPAAFAHGRTWLNFKGINRAADIYFNGTRIGSLDGFMERGRFDVTALLRKDGLNTLAVLVRLPQAPLGNYGAPSYISSAGWDWMPYVPGLNMGITDEVSLSSSGNVLLENPWIRTALPTNARADLSLSVTVKNVSPIFQDAELRGIIQPGDIQFSRKVRVSPGRSADIRLDKEQFNQLVIDNPRLWWPNGYGEPNLYTCRLSLAVGDIVSDTQTIRFGIKRYSYDTAGNVLHVSINGTRVFIKGGDWGMSEYMLRCRGEEYDTKVRLHREMNFNMIRNWIGSTTDEAFYDACDKYGIMVWDEFWLNANPNLPADPGNFNANAVEKIRRFRNHPSIAVWCPDNEGWPEPPLKEWLREDVAVYDGNDRYYQPNSHAENLTGSGPWASYDPRWYFTPYPSGVGGNQGWGLRTELGTAVFPNVESLRKFMPGDKLWPRNELWNLHFFGPSAFNAGPDRYDAGVTGRYGAPRGIEDYCRKAQLLNIETNKAMYEGWEDHIWEDASGIMTWMSQSAYPSMVWQTYDYYYDLTGAYWGAKEACTPLHIQWNPVDNSVKVVNTTGRDEMLTASAAVYNMDGTQVDRYSETQNINAPAGTASRCFILPFGDEQRNLSPGKPAFASSTERGTPLSVTDGNNGTRWSSKASDQEWIYIDLGRPEQVNGVGLNWETAFGKSFRIQVSDDARSWKDVYKTNQGHEGLQHINFDDTTARYVRLLGEERGSGWGYSLWDFDVYGGDIRHNGLSDVHFIRLTLKDRTGKTVDDNFYWRGNRRSDFTALNTLPKATLKVTSTIVRRGGKCYIDARITNPVSAPGIAFAVRVQAVRSSSGEQILPAFMNDGYFTLLKGEMKDIHIAFDEALLGADTPRLVVTPYND